MCNLEVTMSVNDNVFMRLDGKFLAICAILLVLVGIFSQFQDYLVSEPSKIERLVERRE
jgi:hypothetical membrane protein